MTQETSIDAWDHVKVTSLKESQRDVLAAMREIAPCTQRDLENVTALKSKYALSRIRTAVKELEQSGVVYNTFRKVKLESGRSAYLWDLRRQDDPRTGTLIRRGEPKPDKPFWTATTDRLPTTAVGDQVDVLMWSPEWTTWLKGMFTMWNENWQEWSVYDQQNDRYYELGWIPEFWATVTTPD